MRNADKLPERIESALSKGLLKRLPLTFLPFVNQQLDQWQNLFPNERQSVERLLLYVAGLSPEQSAALFDKGISSCLEPTKADAMFGRANYRLRS